MVIALLAVAACETPGATRCDRAAARLSDAERLVAFARELHAAACPVPMKPSTP
ncbi:MAG: hypothetical protein RQ833_12280 [Sphingomonadaceae bacterium]|nr:hypothetical protein [Sphingomonadaceae bacterium]